MDLPSGPFSVILADPPWHFQDQGTRASPEYEGTQRFESHYQTMSLEDICALDVRGIVAENAWLFLWCPVALRSCEYRYTAPVTRGQMCLTAFAEHRGRGYDHAVAKAWGFDLTGSEVVWVKGRIDKGDLRLQIGFGHYTRNAHEICMIAKRGNPVRQEGIPSVLLAPRGKHSAKPDEMYDLIERFCTGPRLELFARGEARAGWSTWGNEVVGDEDQGE